MSFLSLFYHHHVDDVGSLSKPNDAYIDKRNGRRGLLSLCTCASSDVPVAETKEKGRTGLISRALGSLGDIKQMTENLSRLSVNRGGAYIGVSLTATIKALIWWIQDANAQGSTVDPNEWNAEALNNARQRMLLEKQGRDKEDDLVEAPKKLDPSKWLDSYLAFLNFLRGQVSTEGKRTRDYVVRKVPPGGWAPTSREDRLKYNAPLAGPFYAQDNRKVYAQDNRKVYRLTKQWTLNTTAFAWIRPFDQVEDGRGAVAAMQEHYDGPGKTAKKLTKAEAELRTIHYRNEQSMTFESYVNKLNEIYFVFAESLQPLTAEQKVRILCEKITTTKTKLETAMMVIKMDETLKLPAEKYFVKAANKLAE
jgi:hypothetical protein